MESSKLKKNVSVKSFNERCLHFESWLNEGDFESVINDLALDYFDFRLLVENNNNPIFKSYYLRALALAQNNYSVSKIINDFSKTLFEDKVEVSELLLTNILKSMFELGSYERIESFVILFESSSILGFSRQMYDMFYICLKLSLDNEILDRFVQKNRDKISEEVVSFFKNIPASIEDCELFFARMGLVCRKFSLAEERTTREHLLMFLSQMRKGQSLQVDKLAPIEIMNSPISFYYAKNNMSDRCLRITNNEVVSFENYFNISEPVRCLDLVSGIYKNGSEIIRLSPIRVQILMSLVSAGGIGVYESSLIDKVYGGDYYFSQSGKLRTRNLIAQIKTLGFNIKRSNNYFKFVFDDPTLTMILPVDLRLRGYIYYLAKKTKVVTSKEVVDLLDVKPSTAWAMIVEWRKQGVLLKDKSCQYGEYRITDKIEAYT